VVGELAILGSVAGVVMREDGQAMAALRRIPKIPGAVQELGHMSQTAGSLAYITTLTQT
jgi:hypothetical protein